MCTYKWQGKFVRLNDKTKEYVQMANKSEHLDGKTKVYV